MIDAVENYYGTPHDYNKVHQASVQAGNAAAMVANLLTAGRHEQAGVWQAEQASWLLRKDDRIRQAALGKRWLASFATQTICEVFNANIVTKLDT
jgi:hypothetical protein